MVTFKKNELVLDHQFDPRSCRHTVNGTVNVLHCHHYATLYSRLADDCGILDGKTLLAEVAEDTFYEILAQYYQEHGVQSVAMRVSIAEQYYAATGLGQMQVICAGPESGEVKLIHSHVDEGWIKKWGKFERPINFMTSGYIAGLFCAVFNRPLRSFHVTERESIVTGADRSLFEVVAK